MLLQRFHFELEPEITLRLKGSLWMRVKPA
jgi:hypothetical protein